MMSQQKSYISKRFEFKYLLNPIEAKLIERDLCKFGSLTADDHSQNGSYIVNSLYFDTPQMTDFREKDGSLLRRKKMRARMYESNWNSELETVWLEVKHKLNMNVAKTRAGIPKNTWNTFIKSNNALTLLNYARQLPEQKDVRSFAYFFLHGNYKPTAVVQYERVAYIANFTNPIRITFDYNITTCRFEDAYREERLVPVSKNLVVMEIKFNNKLPWWFTHTVEQYNLQRTDFSKYRNSVATMRGYKRIPISK